MFCSFSMQPIKQEKKYQEIADELEDKNNIICKVYNEEPLSFDKIYNDYITNINTDNINISGRCETKFV